MSSFWKIEGYDGTKLIFECKISTGKISKTGLNKLLICLLTKYGKLTDEEIIQNNLILRRKKGQKKPPENDFSLQKDFLKEAYRCGGNPHFIAQKILN
ncbi:MAG: hypothetical protein IIA70_05365 [Proteobacteria bacterium]|nr:hypothetical protein [Pseudomonadota bacterium]